MRSFARVWLLLFAEPEGAGLVHKRSRKERGWFTRGGRERGWLTREAQRGNGAGSQEERQGTEKDKEGSGPHIDMCNSYAALKTIWKHDTFVVQRGSQQQNMFNISFQDIPESAR